ANVHEHHVGVVGGKQLRGVGAVSGFAAHFDVWLGFEDHAQAHADHCLVIYERDANHCSSSERWAPRLVAPVKWIWSSTTGRTAWTRNPPPLRGPHSMLPP